MHLARKFSLTPLAAALTACAATPAALYTGPLTPQAGVCDPPATATLQLRDGQIAFTPNEGTITLRGEAAPNASLTATWQPPRPTPGQAWRFTAPAPPAGADTIAGTYTTPRCTYAVTLRRR